MPGNLPLDSLERFAEYQKRWPQYGAPEVCDICCFTPESGHVRCKNRCSLWAIANISQRLFDYFVSARKEPRRHFEGESLSRLKIDG
jgi:hypothetical protein